MNHALQWKFAAGFVLVFIAGAMTGAFFGSMHMRRVFDEFHQPGLMATRMKERLRSELRLTPEQDKLISPLVDKMAAQLEQIRMETGRRVHQTFVDAHKEMSSHLTEDQRRKLQALEANHRRSHPFPGGHGPPGGPPP